jgi:hypothetical protein
MPRPATHPGVPEVPSFTPAQPGARASSQPAPQAPALPVPNNPGAVPIMTPVMALSSLPLVPSGGTLVSSAVSAGSAPQAHGASTLSGGLVGRAGQSMAQHAQGFHSQPPAYAPVSPPLGYPAAGQTLSGMGAAVPAPMMVPEPMAMPTPSPTGAAVPTLMLHTGRRSRLPLIAGAVAVAAGVVIGVWFVGGRGGSATEVPAATAPAAPVSNKANKRAEEAEAPPPPTQAADVRNADNAPPAPPPAPASARPAEEPPAAAPPTPAAAPASAPPAEEPPAAAPPTPAATAPAVTDDPPADTKHSKKKRHRKPDPKESPWDANSPFLPVH